MCVMDRGCVLMCFMFCSCGGVRKQGVIMCGMCRAVYWGMCEAVWGVRVGVYYGYFFFFCFSDK